MSTSKSHMYTANVWSCNMLNIIDVYFKITKSCIQQMCDVVICWIIIDVYFKVTNTANCDVVICWI